MGYGVDRRNNEFLVEVASEDFAGLNNAVSRTRSKLPIRIEEGTPAVVNAIDLYGGDRISYETDLGETLSYSVGIGGTYNGYDAILTAGHLTEQVRNGEKATFYRSGNNLVGTVEYRQCNNSLNGTVEGDFSIVKLAGAYAATNKIRNATSWIDISRIYSSVPVGTVIFKYGATTGYTCSIVDMVGMVVPFTGYSGAAPMLVKYNVEYYVRGLIRSVKADSGNTNVSAFGDSGGGVYTLYNSKYAIVGTVSGSADENQDGISEYMYTSPIGYAIRVGFSPKLQ